MALRRGVTTGRLARTAGAAALALLLLAAAPAAGGPSGAGGAAEGPRASDGWLHYITPDGRFHATRDPASVPPEAAPLEPASSRSGTSRDLCATVRRMDGRGLGYWARRGLERVQARSEPVRACLDAAAPQLALAMARLCQEHGHGGYQAWSDLVSTALRDCESTGPAWAKPAETVAATER